MITLERVRLVNWHNFNETLIRVGNRCLFAGDNGSGKSTILDAIQYALAADLRKAKFNAAADDRRSGRDLTGYVRCKVGSETTDYRRGDTVAHIMLEFTGFTAGACVEAYTEGKLNEHFWIGGSMPLNKIAVAGPDGNPMLYRQFRDTLTNSITAENSNAVPVQFFDSKYNYLRELTAKLGVFRRLAEYNPYLEALTRSISFKPLDSVDKFVCDYILEDRPVDISDMKANLESYKEAERQARGVVKRIEALKKICSCASEWYSRNGLILKQEYLKLRIEKANQEQKKNEITEELLRAEKKIAALTKDIESFERKRFEWEQELRETDASLAANNAHLMYEALLARIERLKRELEKEQKLAGEYDLIRSQCEALLDRPLKKNPEDDIGEVEKAERDAITQKETAARQKEAATESLREVLAELSALDRGILRYPGQHTALRDALVSAGIDAEILADAAEIRDPVWADAAEGWLNTRRFAVLVNPDCFQRALEIYDGLPRSLGGALLPDIARMRDAKPQPGSLAELVSSESTYAGIYLNYALGNVICADIKTLKNFSFAVTRECMTYGNFTASRMREEVYRRHYLGQAARKERREFLNAEKDRLKREHSGAERREREYAAKEDIFRRVRAHLPKLVFLFPSVARAEELRAEIAAAEQELAAIDTDSFRELQQKRDALAGRIQKTGKELDGLRIDLGGEEKTAANCRAELEVQEERVRQQEDVIHLFGEENSQELNDCEKYAEEKLSSNTVRELSLSYESTLKNFRTRAENLKAEYQKLVLAFDREFNALFSLDPAQNGEAERVLKRLETSELPEYREKIARAKRDAEREFKEHFISRLNELIEEARESFKEINDILRSLSFGHDQYRFTLEERNDRKRQIDIVRKAAEIPPMEDGLFSQLVDPAESKAAEDLFNQILNANLDSPQMRTVCDYRTYFNYDIKIRQTDTIDQSTGKPMELSLSKVLREKSGGETQTPYYVAIAASFYRYYKARPEETIRLVMFDEAFNRMDDERIGKILQFYQELNIQIIISVPTEKIEAVEPYMDQTNLVIRYSNSARVRDCHRDVNREERGVEEGAVSGE